MGVKAPGRPLCRVFFARHGAPTFVATSARSRGAKRFRIQRIVDGARSAGTPRARELIVERRRAGPPERRPIVSRNAAGRRVLGLDPKLLPGPDRPAYSRRMGEDSNVYGAPSEAAQAQALFPEEEKGDIVAAGFGIRAGARIIDTIIGLVLGFGAGVLVGLVAVVLAAGGSLTVGWQHRLGAFNGGSLAIGLLGPIAYHTAAEWGAARRSGRRSAGCACGAPTCPLAASAAPSCGAWPTSSTRSSAASSRTA